jgi:predicted component of type VI protein secretion system
MYRKFFAVMMLFAATIMIGCSKDKKEEGGESEDAKETSATAPLDVNQVKLDVTKMT